MCQSLPALVPYCASIVLVGTGSLSGGRKFFIHPANNGYMKNVKCCLGDSLRFPG